MTATEFLARLEGVKAAGPGRWAARCPCPVHPRGDRRPSLSIAVGEKGVVLKCFTGCDTKDIVRQLGLSLSDLFHQRAAGASARGAKKASSDDIVYSYNDEAGELLFQVVRGPNKKFLQRRPDPANPGRWIFKLNGVRRVPYRLPELTTVSTDVVVFAVEGEKDVDNLRQEGLVATTNSGGVGAGAKQWKERSFVAPFAGRHVVVIPDNDEPGRRHAQLAAAELVTVAASVKVLELPGLPPKGDVSDWLAAGGTATKLLELAAACPPWCPPPAPHRASTSDQAAPEKVSQSQLLVAFAREQSELFRNDAMEPFATITRDGHRETWPIPSKGEQSTFRNFLIERFLSTTGRAPSSQALGEAIETIRALALIGSNTRPVALRVAEHGGCLYLDLCDQEWRVVEISREVMSRALLKLGGGRRFIATPAWRWAQGLSDRRRELAGQRRA